MDAPERPRCARERGDLRRQDDEPSTGKRGHTADFDRCGYAGGWRYTPARNPRCAAHWPKLPRPGHARRKAGKPSRASRIVSPSRPARRPGDGKRVVLGKSRVVRRELGGNGTIESKQNNTQRHNIKI